MHLASLSIIPFSIFSWKNNALAAHSRLIAEQMNVAR
jgi:hypothetical protein